ncbi:hypothetical protein PsorP6_006126 [Peronosclerospora sorghi]|uniref:Uncharacterized protein n=1 Tax=Peronosclerospora sorghi TaxID=230839 RepID=A0ACC0W3P9_9STRA|nr:hypothetical protein PsorP6_006126 [Peronosclerospora sorghi]
MERRLKTDGADNIPVKTVVDDSPAVDVACAQDATSYCQKEASVAALLREAPDLVDPRRMVDAVHNMRLCMIQHVDVLSTDCAIALSAENPAKASTIVASLPLSSKKIVALNDDGTDDDSSIEIKIYYSRHHRVAEHALRSDAALAANHVQSGEASFSYRDVLAHPVTWAFVLPFFVVGIYVSIARLSTFLRRRREERRIESKLYMSVR